MLREETTGEREIVQLGEPVTWALCGGIFGALLVTAHVALDVFEVLPGCHLPLHPRGFREGNPFVHVLSEMAIFGGGLAVAFSLAAAIRNRLKKA